MPKVDPALLDAALARALAGDPGPLAVFLRAHSNLPGPRGNLELAWQFADDDGRPRRRGCRGAAWRVASGLAAVGPQEAPTGDPGEFVAFCGTLGGGGLRGRAGPEAGGLGDRARGRRRTSAGASGRRRPRPSSGPCPPIPGGSGRAGRVGRRRVVAPRVAPWPPAWPIRHCCGTRRWPRPALRLHEGLLARFTWPPGTGRTTGTRCFARASGTPLSVVVAAAPVPGFALLRRLAAIPDRDLGWVLRSNLGKGRLARAHPREVEAVRALLAG